MAKPTKSKKTPAKRGKQQRTRKPAAEVIRVGGVGWRSAEQLRKHVAKHGWGDLASTPEVAASRPTLGLVVNEAVKAALRPRVAPAAVTEPSMPPVVAPESTHDDDGEVVDDDFDAHPDGPGVDEPTADAA